MDFTASVEFTPGDIVAGRYQLQRVIGEGGMGIVWSGVHLTTGRAVAIKVLKRNEPADTARLLREARVAASFRHRNIVQVFDLFQLSNTGALVMVMDLLRGESLAERLSREGPISLPVVAELFTAVTSALKSAHERGFVHRDLKPENIFLAQEDDGHDVVKVLDFGLARSMDLVEGNITHTGSVLGTPHYMAPEQVYGERNLERSVDVWALGVVLVECLSGQILFEGENFGQIFKKITTGDPARLDALLGELPSEVKSPIVRMLSVDPSQRPSDEEVLTILGRWCSQSESSSMQKLATAPTEKMTSVPLPTAQHANLAASVHLPKKANTGKRLAAISCVAILLATYWTVRPWLAHRAMHFESATSEQKIQPAMPLPELHDGSTPSHTPTENAPPAVRDAGIEQNAPEQDAGAASAKPKRPRVAQPKPSASESSPANFLDGRF